MWLFRPVYLMPCISRPTENIPAGVTAFCPSHFASCRLKSDVHTEECSNAGIPYSLAGPFVVQLHQHTFLASCSITAASRDGAQHLAAHIRYPDAPAACTSSTLDAPHWRGPAHTDTLGAGKCTLNAKPIGEAGCTCRITAFVIGEVLILVCRTPGIRRSCYMWVRGHVPRRKVGFSFT